MSPRRRNKETCKVSFEDEGGHLHRVVVRTRLGSNHQELVRLARLKSGIRPHIVVGVTCAARGPLGGSFLPHMRRKR